MEQSTVRQPHRLVLENRKKSMISGVQDVQSFHEQEILLLTEEGKLQIKGEGLHVKRLNLEKGEADIEGKINSLIYLSRNTPKKDEKLLKYGKRDVPVSDSGRNWCRAVFVLQGPGNFSLDVSGAEICGVF